MEKDIKKKTESAVRASELVAMASEVSAEQREMELRRLMQMDYEDKLFIPPECIPPHLDYYWVRLSVRDLPDTSRMVQMKRKGWTPVRASEHPDLIGEDFFGRLEKFDGYIYQDGLILCSRPKTHGKIEKEMIDAKNYQTLVSMPGTEHFLGEPNMPGTFSGETYLSKATRPASFGR